MKKTIRKCATVLVLALFILSIVPMAFADKREKEENMFSKEGNSKEVKFEEANEQMKEQREAMKERFKEQREFTKEQIEQLRERMQMAKEKYEMAREEYKEQKDELKDLREQFKKCDKEEDDNDDDENETETNDTQMGTNQTSDCVKIKKNVNRGVRNHLEKTIELIDNSLARLTQHVNSSTVLSEEDKQSALASINKLEEQVTAEKEKVLAMGDDVSKEDLKAAVKELKQLWQDVSKLQKRIVAMLTSSKLENLVQKHQDIADSMQKRIDDAKAKGLDTAELESILAKFKTAVAKLEEDQKTARNFWQQTEDVSKENMEKWHDALEVVKDDLKETKNLLHDFMENYRELIKSSNPEQEGNNDKDNATEED